VAARDSVSSTLGLNRFFGPMPSSELPVMDVPLLHDSYAPVENLLIPVTDTGLGREYYLGLTGPSFCGYAHNSRDMPSRDVSGEVAGRATSVSRIPRGSP
jgi:hypothetical protein